MRHPPTPSHGVDPSREKTAVALVGAVIFALFVPSSSPGYRHLLSCLSYIPTYVPPPRKLKLGPIYLYLSYRSIDQSEHPFHFLATLTFVPPPPQ